MKKYFLFIFCTFLLFVVTGCGKNQITCTGTAEEEGVKLDAKVVGTFDKNNKLTDAVVEYELNDEKTAETYCSFIKMMEDKDKGITVECKGKKITVTGYANITDEDDSNDEALLGKSKEEFKKFLEENDEVKMTCE